MVNPIELPSSNSNSQQGKLSPVLTPDLMDLANLRYDEWISSTPDADTNDPPPPSKRAFAMATAEIAQERSELGAVPFLAKLRDNSRYIPVGAAELSLAEFEGAVSTNRNCWYVTDVVTSSKHRRMGIANQLMDCVERYAYDHDHGKTSDGTFTTNGNRNNATTTTLYLHVKPDNQAALQFYQSSKRGYAVPKFNELEGLDCEKLAENAGTKGQLLLCKTLTIENLPPTWNSADESDGTETPATPAATGFGNAGTNPVTKKKKKTKRKRK